MDANDLFSVISVILGPRAVMTRMIVAPRSQGRHLYRLFAYHRDVGLSPAVSGTTVFIMTAWSAYCTCADVVHSLVGALHQPYTKRSDAGVETVPANQFGI